MFHRANRGRCAPTWRTSNERRCCHLEIFVRPKSSKFGATGSFWGSRDLLKLFWLLFFLKKPFYFISTMTSPKISTKFRLRRAMTHQKTGEILLCRSSIIIFICLVQHNKLAKVYKTHKSGLKGKAKLLSVTKISRIYWQNNSQVSSGLWCKGWYLIFLWDLVLKSLLASDYLLRHLEGPLRSGRFRKLCLVRFVGWKDLKLVLNRLWSFRNSKANCEKNFPILSLSPQLSCIKN